MLHICSLSQKLKLAKAITDIVFPFLILTTDHKCQCVAVIYAQHFECLTFVSLPCCIIFIYFL